MFTKIHFTLALSLFLLAPLSSNAATNSNHIPDIEIEFATSLSRQIGWFDSTTGKVVYDQIVNRFSLFCFDEYCRLNILSIPARNCTNIQEKTNFKFTLPSLESTQAGSDIDSVEHNKNGTGDLSISQHGKDTILIEYPSSLGQLKNSILVTYKDRFGDGTSKLPIKVSGNATGIEHALSGSQKVVSFQYHPLPESTICTINMQGHKLNGQ